MGSFVPKEKVLLTGGSGFIASHILDTLLAEGFSVVVTTRSHKKGQAIIDSLDEQHRPDVGFAVVEDVTLEGAFDHVFRSEHVFDYVVHTASPCIASSENPVQDILDPAIKGTTGMLKTVHTWAPTVKRVVITSSSTAIFDPWRNHGVKSENNWATYTWEDALKPENTYAASKAFAEQAAWTFVREQKPRFALATINNTYTFGPLPRHVADLDDVNLTNRRIRDCVLGKWLGGENNNDDSGSGIPATLPVFTFVDVRDVALAHVRALTRPGAAGRRFYVVGGYSTNRRIVEIVRRTHPRLAQESKLPDVQVVMVQGAGESGSVVKLVGDDLPEDVHRFDTSRSKTVLGLEYRSLETSVRDTVSSILERLPSS